IETKIFPPYKKPDTGDLLFLDNSFSRGSIIFVEESRFGFETGFRYEDKRLSTVVIYNESGHLQEITVISEVLKGSQEESNLISPQQFSGIWKGKPKTINSNWIVSEQVLTTYDLLQNDTDDYLKLYLPEGVYVNFPSLVEAEKDFSMTVNWLINPNLLLSGIRNYEASGFTGFTVAELASY
ncbi:MAG: DUF3598 family protein, partial [Cyanobacteria bacterium J06635_10]